MSGECCGNGHGRKGKGHHSGHKKGHGKKSGCCCDCCCGHGGWRNFRTKQEKIDELESYKEELEKELKAVEEKIEHMRSH